MNIVSRLPRLTLVLVVCLGVLIAALATAKVRISKGIVIRIDARGEPHLWGVPLASTNLQRIVYSTLIGLGARGTVSITAPPVTNTAALSNWIVTVENMNKAGLLKPTGPKRTAAPPNPLLP